MTAYRVIDTHAELEDVSNNLTHAQIDRSINSLASSSAIVLSASSNPYERRLIIGTGLTSSDGGPGSTFTLAIDNNQSLTADGHKSLKQLIHFMNDGPGDGFFASPFKEVVGIPFVDRVTWWDSPTKQKRIYQTEFTRSLVNKVTTQRAYKIYDTDGFTTLITAIDTITYVSGVFEASRTRTFI